MHCCLKNNRQEIRKRSSCRIQKQVRGKGFTVYASRFLLLTTSYWASFQSTTSLLVWCCHSMINILNIRWKFMGMKLSFQRKREHSKIVVPTCTHFKSPKTTNKKIQRRLSYSNMNNVENWPCFSAVFLLCLKHLVALNFWHMLTTTGRHNKTELSVRHGDETPVSDTMCVGVPPLYQTETACTVPGLIKHFLRLIPYLLGLSERYQ